MVNGFDTKLKNLLEIAFLMQLIYFFFRNERKFSMLSQHSLFQYTDKENTFVHFFLYTFDLLSLLTNIFVISKRLVKER